MAWLGMSVRTSVSSTFSSHCFRMEESHCGFIPSAQIMIMLMILLRLPSYLFLLLPFSNSNPSRVLCIIVTICDCFCLASTWCLYNGVEVTSTLKACNIQKKGKMFLLCTCICTKNRVQKVGAVRRAVSLEDE